MAAAITKPITILHYEDTPSYRDSFKGIAQANRIIVDAVDNVDVLLEKLEENPKKHKFIVLDARAYLHEGQTSGSENEANLIKIFREIERISLAQGRLIPYCINTGFADLVVSHQEVVDCPIFEKGQEQKLIDHIWETYNDSSDAVLRKNHPVCFEFADTYFDEANLAILTAILKDDTFKSNNIAIRVSTLAYLRRLNEHLMDILFDKYLNSPSEVIKSKATRANDIFYYIRDNAGLPTQIFGAITNIYKVASEYGSHTPEDAQKIQDYPSNNTTIALTYSFLESIHWANNLLK